MKKIFAVLLCALALCRRWRARAAEVFPFRTESADPGGSGGTHEAYGRTISFRAPVYVPDVDTLPILRVKRTCISAQTAEALGDSLEKNTLYRPAGSHAAGRACGKRASHFTAYVQNLWTSAADEAAIFLRRIRKNPAGRRKLWRGKLRHCSANSNRLFAVSRGSADRNLCATARKKADITSRRGNPCAAYRL